MIEVENLTKRYGRHTAVDGISFRVHKGEILGFLGPNGAGKTTTMRILTCYLPPTDGAARVAGYDVFAQPLEVKRRVGYTPEPPAPSPSGGGFQRVSPSAWPCPRPPSTIRIPSSSTSRPRASIPSRSSR